MGCAHAAARHERVVGHEVVRAGGGQKRSHEEGRQPAEHAQPETRDGRTSTLLGEAQDLARHGEAGPHAFALRRDRTSGPDVVRADEASRDEPVPTQSLDHLALAPGQLEVEVGTDLGRLFHEEAQGVVEARRVRPDVLRVVRHHEPASVPDHVELDEIHPSLNRSAEGGQRILGGEHGGSAMADAQRATRALFDRDHGDGLVGR
jgi:hypothetical protein